MARFSEIVPPYVSLFVFLLLTCSTNCTRPETFPVLRRQGFFDDAMHRMKAIPSFVEQHASMSKENATKQRVRFGDGSHTTLTCKDSIKHLDAQCPPACPLAAENDADQPEGICFFRCVLPEDCGKSPGDPLATVADIEKGICRRCWSPGCEDCISNSDNCKTCSPGYELQQDGKCHSVFEKTWTIVLGSFGGVFLFLVLWIFDLVCRPVSNPEGLTQGLAFRAQSTLSMSEEKDGDKSNIKKFPILTDLCNTPVGGPGTALHFSFQFFVLVWSSLLLCIWILLVNFTSAEQYILGLRDAPTPQIFCSVISWGRATQLKYMWVKVTFLSVSYVITFVGSIVFAWRQKQKFEHFDNQCITMKDFAALVEGLPSFPGTSRPETMLKTFFETEFGEKVVGVSVIWDCKSDYDVIMKELLNEDHRIDREYRRSVIQSDSKLGGDMAPIPESKNHWPIRRFWMWFDTCVPLFTVPAPEDSSANNVQENLALQTRLAEMQTTRCALVVFNTEKARENACAIAAKGTITFEGHPLKLTPEDHEPETYKWQNFNTTLCYKVLKVVLGILGILICLVLWMIAFYLPWAYYVASFSYAAGSEPGFVSGTIFSLLVAVGNQIVYYMCDYVAESMCLRSTDSTATAYVVLYNFASTLNTILDLLVTALLSFKIMIAQNTHTSDGQRLDRMATWDDLFEAYPMQRTMGMQLYLYAFPSCFLIPFVMEPLFTIILPKFIAVRVVGSHSEMRGRVAEDNLQFFIPMDLGRYADVLQNVTICAFILLFPGGNILPTFCTFLACHIYVFLYDKYRVLRCVPSFHYASDMIDRYALKLSVGPCAVILCALILKSNALIEHTAEQRPLSGLKLFQVVLIAFIVHCCVHTYLIEKAQAMASTEHRVSEEEYANVAKRIPCTWFNANPVQCLRSKLIYEHQPPAQLYVRGREHLLRKNPEIGQCFEAESFAAEDDHDWQDIMKTVTLGDENFLKPA